jgi:hypothetical protein
MIKFNVGYTEGVGRSMLFNTIVIEAADLETCKKAANQWRVTWRVAGKLINILSILEA